MTRGMKLAVNRSESLLGNIMIQLLVSVHWCGYDSPPSKCNVLSFGRHLGVSSYCVRDISNAGPGLRYAVLSATPNRVLWWDSDP